MMSGLVFCNGCGAEDDEPCRSGCLAIAPILDNSTLTYSETAAIMRRWDTGLDRADAARLFSMSGYDPFNDSEPRRMLYNTRRFMYSLMFSHLSA